jgi:hypothetical protein
MEPVPAATCATQSLVEGDGTLRFTLGDTCAFPAAAEVALVIVPSAGMAANPANGRIDFYLSTTRDTAVTYNVGYAISMSPQRVEILLGIRAFHWANQVFG